MEKTFEPFLSKMVGWIIRKMFDKYSGKTTLEILSEITDNKELIAVLCAQCGNYGLSPKYSSFAVHALVISHFMDGGYYPVGGADQLALKAIENFKKHGGETYIRADVTKIVTKKNRVTGIKINNRFIPCKNVISNAGVNNTINHLIERDAADKYFNPPKLQPSTGHLCLYVGLNKSDADLNLPKHNIWWFENEHMDDLLDEVTLPEAAAKFAYISFPSAKDPNWQTKQPGTATIQALTIGKYEWFSKYEPSEWMKRGEDYEQLKKDFETAMLEKLYELFPQIKGHVARTEVSTPLSTKHFSNYKSGEIYGLAHNPARFKLPFLRPKTKIKGLWLVGQDVTVVGVAGAMLSGILCAIAILRFKVWRMFKEMRGARPEPTEA